MAYPQDIASVNGECGNEIVITYISDNSAEIRDDSQSLLKNAVQPKTTFSLNCLCQHEAI